MKTLPSSAVVRVLDALIRAKQPCTAAELGSLSRRVVSHAYTTEQHRRSIDRWRITRPLRSLREHGLIERAPNPRRSARRGRPSYVYVPTAYGREWLIDKMHLP